MQEVSKRFGDVEALRHVTLSLPEGVVGLLGPNGAGKSTLFRLLLGLERADAGTVQVLDRRLPEDAVAVRSRVGYMPEDDSLFPEMTATEQVVHAAQLSGVAAMDATPRAHQALDLVGLADNRYRKATLFSLGQRQRLRLAMALCHGPQLLIADEPTAGLDPDGRAEMLALLAEIAKQGTSVILSTHILADVEAICAYVVLMTQGQISFAGPIARFRATGGGPAFAVRVVGEPGALLAALQRRHIAAAVQDGEVVAQLATERLVELWQVCADVGVGVSGLRPMEEDMASAFMRHVEHSGDLRTQRLL